MTQQGLEEEFISWVGSDSFSCLGARAALRQNTLFMHVYEELNSDKCSEELYRDLIEFIDTKLKDDSDFASFVAIFRAPYELSEEEFEERLWGQLARLHDIDSTAHSWSADVSSDVNAPDFAFSVGGRPFFVAGLNPGSSRISRRFSRTALVFNAHDQFRRLKADGTYYGLQRRIRAKELKLQGSVNPMLTDHGVSSEARQYSGRAVPQDWQCPFRAGPQVSTPVG
ncbi:guanitoxin biosynthesis heme-dependent pre-guanitoxin N-hydroxylase GntA [Streptomyces coelicoflavus]|uniref:guanitoxin biosynthesis heme-dependent pre-guanitoxin N-hydroxylase GntA n=1 Tax=Streptomyces coelicoflavus TaxID=285562 RepID=UPI002E25E989